MGCINAKPSRTHNLGANPREKIILRRPPDYGPPPGAAVLARERGSETSVIDRKGGGGGGSNGVPVEHALRNKVRPENVIHSAPINGAVREAELIAAGWPAWLVSAASPALVGWVPRKASTIEKLDKIGQGTYSSVYKARDLTNGKTVALKKVRFDNLDPESVTFMAREILILRRLDHPNIIKLEGLITSSESCSLYLIFEYMEHDLTGLASAPGIKFSEPQIKCYMKQLLSGLEHCHANGVLHRDIKGSNLLINDHGNLKIADFGLATFYEPRRNVTMTSRVVTLWYRPPELLLGARKYSYAVDMWSVGCILGELYTGKPLMPGRTEVEQLHAIFKLCGSPSDEFWMKSKLRHGEAFKPQHPYKNRIAERLKDIPSTALSLIETLLSVDPSFRGTATSALESEFFTMEPLPCDPSSLPKYPPSKEIDAKLREDRLRRREAIEGCRTKPDQGKRKPQHYDAAEADKANADLIASVELQERKRQTFLTNRSETFNSHSDALQHSLGHHRTPPLLGRMGTFENVCDNLHNNNSKVAAYSGPLTRAPQTWSKEEKKPTIELHLAQRIGFNKPAPPLLFGSVTMKGQEDLDPPARHDDDGAGGLVLVSKQKQGGGGGSRQNSRFSNNNNAGGGGGGQGDEQRAYHSQNAIYSNRYPPHIRRLVARVDSFEDNAKQDDAIHFSGPLGGLPSRNMEEMLRDRDRQMLEAARRSRSNDKLKQQNQVATSHLLVPSR